MNNVQNCDSYSICAGFRTSETRFHLCTEARNTIQEAALNVQTAQAMLPGVQFPYCTTREISAVLQVGLV
jgi:hypothetical protein